MDNTVFIATDNQNEMMCLTRALGADFNVKEINSTEWSQEGAEGINVLLADYRATPRLDIKTLSAKMPVLVLTPFEDPQYAIEALQVGGNFIVKFGDYYQFLPAIVADAIDRFNELKGMRAAIDELQAKNEELKAQLLMFNGEEFESPAERVTGGQTTQRAKIIDEIAKRLKGGEINLPSLPEVNVKFQDLVNNGATYKEISELLRKDVAIASKLIAVSNSPIYRGLDENKNLDQAIFRLGVETTQKYVNIISNRSLYTVRQRKYMPFVEHLWGHSLACAYVSQAIVEICGITVEADPFILGLFHDIGKLVLLQVISEMEMKGIMEHVAKEEVLDTMEAYHNTFGAVLLKRWKYNDCYVEVANYHNNLPADGTASNDVLVVHFANLLAKGAGFLIGKKEEKGIILEQAPSALPLNINSETIGQLKKMVSVHMEEMARIFV